MKAPTGSRKNSRKPCKEDCPGLILQNGRYCSHIEMHLPTLRKTKSVSFVTYDQRIEKYFESYGYASTTEDQITNLTDKLFKYGLNPYEVELILARYVEEKTLREIASQLGWTDHNSVNYHLTLALHKLKERKFRL